MKPNICTTQPAYIHTMHSIGRHTHTRSYKMITKKPNVNSSHVKVLVRRDRSIQHLYPMSIYFSSYRVREMKIIAHRIVQISHQVRCNIAIAIKNCVPAGCAPVKQ